MTERTYTDTEIEDICTRIRQVTSQMQWQRMQASLVRDFTISDTAAFRLIWGLCTGYRKPVAGLPPADYDNLTWGENKALELYAKQYANDRVNAAAFLGWDLDTYNRALARIRSKGRQGLLDRGN